MIEFFPPLFDSLIIIVAGVVAGTINAVAGGGTFFAFPALMMTGSPALIANATCSVGIWPGVVASTLGYKNQLSAYKHYLPALCTIGIIGGALGGWILMKTTNEAFKEMVPWLLLAATLLFAFGKKITAFIRRFATGGKGFFTYAAIAVTMTVIAIYGGFFGAGVGILLLAMFQVMQLDNIHEMNALKVLVSIAIHGAAVVALLFSDLINWPQAILLMIGTVIGGYFTSKWVQGIPQPVVRAFVLSIAVATTLYYFDKQYGIVSS
jgi:uncharacterized membrane protein YfcA